MTEHQIEAKVKSAEPMVSLLAQFPANKRELARVALESFGAGLLAARSGEFGETPHSEGMR